MLASFRRTLRDMTLGALVALCAVAYAASPYIDWRLHLGNENEEIAQAGAQAVAMADMLPPVKPHIKGAK